MTEISEFLIASILKKLNRNKLKKINISRDEFNDLIKLLVYSDKIWISKS